MGEIVVVLLFAPTRMGLCNYLELSHGVSSLAPKVAFQASTQTSATSGIGLTSIWLSEMLAWMTINHSSSFLFETLRQFTPKNSFHWTPGIARNKYKCKYKCKYKFKYR